MKKRLLCIALTLCMVLTLFPVAAFAASNNITITKQPVDCTVCLGETATFIIEAKNSGSSTVNYVWADADKVDTDNINDFSTFISTIGDAKLGEGKELKLTNVTEDMDGRTFVCIAYATQLGWPPFVFVISDHVTLHVNAVECDSHSLVINLEKIDAEESTCAEEGNVTYYHCTVCNRYYLDEAGTVKITPDQCKIPKLTTHASISHVDAVGGTCCEYGHIAYYQCDICGQKFSDAEGTAPITDEDIRTDKIPASHTNLQHFDAVAATCCEEGNIEYWYCDGCRDYFTDAAGKNKTTHAKLDTDRDQYNHSDLVEVPAKEATCEAPGNIRYWYCSGCNGYYSDPAGHSEITKSKTVLAQLPHSYEWFAMSQEGAEWHEYRCKDCGYIKESGTHTGGEAGCCEKAVCETCGLEYGSTDPENHKNLERQIFKEATPTKDGLCNIICQDCGQMIEENVPYAYKDTCIHSLILMEEVPAKCEDCEDAQGVKAHYVCEKCGTMFWDENGEEEITDADELVIAPHEHFIKVEVLGDTTVLKNVAVYQYAYDTTGHWYECKYCHYTYPDTFQTHTVISDAKPTCCSGKTCLICGWDDGTRDLDNHVGNTELVGACEPADGKPGYTGDVVCLGCEAVLVHGRYYYYKCGECAQHLKHIDAIPSTCTMDGTKEYWQCTKCCNIYMDEKATVDADNESIVDKCMGHELHPGMDLLTSSDVISLATKLGWSYSDLLALIKSGNYSDLKNIRIEDFLDQITIKDIDHCYDDECHWLGCQKCGSSLADIREDLEADGILINEKWYAISEKQVHSGGIATCSSKAICASCGEEYGELGDHRYLNVVTEATCTEQGYTTHTCVYCSNSYEDNYTNALGHDFGEWIVETAATWFDDGLEKRICSRCGASESQVIPALCGDEIHVPDGINLNPAKGEHFIADGPCTRAEFAYRTWLYAGRPEPNTHQNYVDMDGYSDCYIEAVDWCFEVGIIAGISFDKFGPNYQFTKAQLVTYIWRFYGAPKPQGNDNPFADVNNSGSTSPYYYAIIWAYENGLVTPDENGNFNPNSTCAPCHVHSYSVSHKDPTCTEDGYNTYTCACGDSFTETIEALGHNIEIYGEKAATCTVGGYTGDKVCSRCNSIIEKGAVVVALGHDRIRINATAATCLEPGYTGDAVCKRCGILIANGNEIPALGHNYGEWTVTTAATCTDKGIETRYCSRCDATETREVAALGHDFDAWKVTTAATCTDKGIETRYCSRCDAAETREVAALGHDLVHHDGKAASCTENGWEAYDTCSRCDYTNYKEIPAAGHDYKAVVTAPTCTEKGYTTYTCACGDSYIADEVAALGHDFDAWKVTTAATCTDKGIETRYCSRCDAAETREVAALGHDLVHHDGKAASCTENGWEAYDTCSRCDYTNYKEIPAAGHDYKAVVTAPTCTEKGYTTYTCACGDSYIADEVAALGHDFGEWTVTTAATCTEKGEETRCCNRCNATETREIAALGHDYTDGACTGCGEKDPDYKPPVQENPFVDVLQGKPYYDAVLWAYYHKPQQITGGFDATHFVPNNPCTRAQVVTFLWRAKGCPDPTSTNNPFSDVSEKQSNGKDNPYYTAILWAAEQGITTGYAGGLFKPNDTVTRAQFVTFLWRADGRPDTSGSINGFADAAQIATPYQQAVAWAVEKGITTGYAEGDGTFTFRPNAACTRWAVVLFMYRDMK